MKLNHLSDTNLLKIMHNLAQEERSVLAKVLWHLREIDERKLYSDMKCASLFEYCVKVLKYSEGQASRRVSACRLLGTIPSIMPRIERGEINLTQLSQASSFFEAEGMKSSEEKIKVLDDIAGKPTRETERILDDLRTQEKPKRKPVFLKQETIDLLKEVQDMKAHSHHSLDEVIVELVKLAKREWDPTVVKRKSSVTESNTRYVPAQVRAAVWERDKSQCQNCGSKRALEIDHIQAFALGGKSNVANLRLLCRNCNQRRGIVTFPNQGRMRSSLK